MKLPTLFSKQRNEEGFWIVMVEIDVIGRAALNNIVNVKKAERIH